jgi:phage tail-like protein
MSNGAHQQPITVDHVVDHYRRYPGETLTFYTRVNIHAPISAFTLRVTLPAGLTMGDYQLPATLGDRFPELEVEDETRYLVWQVEQDLLPGYSLEYQLQTLVAPADSRDFIVESEATVLHQGQIIAAESISVAILTTGVYMQYLPSIYHNDDFMRRFLMLFESFLAPIELQIDNLPYYFDPRTAPIDLLPWLAAWNDLEFDERWPEERKRWLIRASASLYKRRGTRQGLIDYLEMYTGVKPQIIEHRSRNFHLGAEGVLGPGIALGHANQPHTFSVSLSLPLLLPLDGEDEADLERREAARQRMIVDIIEAEKPAHTSYTLDLETQPPNSQADASTT